MNSIEIIKNILHKNYIHVKQDKLTEEEKDQKGKKFKVEYEINKPREVETALYKFDYNTFPFFSEIKGLKKMCDYILFAQEREWLHVFLIELKLSNTESALQQLNAAKEFVHFILNSALRVNSNSKIEHYKVRKIRIVDKNAHKKRTTKMSDKDFEYKDDYLDYKCDTFQLRKLINYS